VRVSLRSSVDHQDFSAEVRFRYQPPPPQLTLLGIGKAKPGMKGTVIDIESATEDLPIRFEVKPGLKEEKAAVRITHQAKNKEAAKLQQFETAEATRREVTVKLLPGLNTIELVAEDAADAELSARLVVQAAYKPEPVRVVLQEIVPFPAEEKTQIEIVSGRPVLVHTPKVRVKGVVKAEGKVTATWSQGKKQAQPLPLAADKSFEQELTLDPGSQDFTFTASGAGEQKDSAVVTINFAPLPPAITLLTPKPVFEETHKGKVRVEGRLPDERAPYPPGKLVVFVNDKAVKDGDAEVAIQEKENTVQILIPLTLGEYRIHVQLENKWGQKTPSNSVTVAYLSPPRELRIEPLKVAAKKPLVDLRATLISRLEVTRLEATAWKKGTAKVYPVQTLKPKQIDPKQDLWEVVLQDVPLAEGANVVHLTASNAHGQAQRDGELELEYTPPIEPPTIEVQSSPEYKSSKRDYDLRFRVLSRAPLQLIEVVQDKSRHRPKEDVTKITKNDQGQYEFKGSVRVPLQSGLNQLEIVAANAGGVARSPTVQVNFVPLPVRLEIDAISPRDGKPIALERGTNNELLVAQVSQPQLILRGRAVWEDANDPTLRTPKLEIHSYVNGFRQMIGELQPATPGETERKFRIDVLLNRERDNRIDFELPELPTPAEKGPLVRIDKCGKFHPNQRLHLLILGVNQREGKELRDRVLSALRATKTGNYWRTEVFERVELYGPVTLEPEHLLGQFNSIKGNIQARGIEGTSDIVMIYFKGSEAIQDEQHTLTGLRDKQRKRVEAALSSSKLAEFFKENRGAQLLFLDVMRDAPSAGKDQIKEWKDDARVSRVGVFRYSWLATNAPEKLPDDAQMDYVLHNAARLRDVQNGLNTEAEQLGKKYPKGQAQFPYFYLVPALGDAVVNYIPGK
jgi:hypothetical protein